MRREYQLPNGKITISVKKYVREWRKISTVLEQKYDLRTIGFDPHLLMADKSRDHITVHIPLWLAKRMVAVENGQ
jgi:hypothetical protein